MGPPGPPPGAGQDRGTLILVLSLASFLVMFFGCSMCGPLSLLSLGLSIPALVMARRDLAAIDAGTLSPNARSATHTGMIVAIVSTVLSALIGVVMIVLVLLYGGLIGFALLQQGGAGP
jgi:hypothetical protein